MKSSHPRLNIIFSILLGVCLGLSVASQVIDLSLPFYWLLLIFAAFSAIGFYVAKIIIERILLPILESLSPKIRLLWIVSCMLSGFFLVLTVPLMVYPKPHLLRIVATGEKNQASQSSEVWLQSIVSGDWAASYHIRSCKGNWRIIDKVLVSVPESQPSELKCRIGTAQDIYVQFGMHAWSGKVRLRFENQVIDEDLYSAEGGLKLVQLPITLSRLDRSVWLLLFVVDAISIGVILLAILLWLAYVPVGDQELKCREAVRWYWYGLFMGGVWLLLLLVFWPGFLSTDVYNQFQEIVAGQFNDWHPAFHTFFLWLMTRVWFSPAPAIIVQILALSSLLGCGLSLVERSGTPRWLTWTLALLFAASPAIGLILLNPWKDTPYGISVVALSLLCFYYVRKEDRKFGFGFWFCFFIISVCVALFRHNGPPVAFGVLLFLILFDRQHRRSFAIVFVLASLSWLSIRGPVYSALNVNRDPQSGGENLGVYSTLYYLVYNHARANTYFTPSEAAIFSEVPIDPENRTVDTEQLGKHADEILDMAVKLSFRNPLVTVRYFLAKFAFILQVLQPPRARLGFVEMDIHPNPYGLAIDSQIPFLQRYVKKIAYLSEEPQIDWLFWRNAFWMYLLIAASVVASVRMKNWKYIVVILPVVLNAIPLMVLSGGHISRYIFSTLIIGPLFGVGLLFLRPAVSARSLGPERQQSSSPLDLDGGPEN